MLKLDIKWILGIIGAIFMIGIGSITYFVGSSYNKIDRIYEYTIKHEYEFQATKQSLIYEDSKLWQEVLRINKDLSEMEAEFNQNTN